MAIMIPKVHTTLCLISCLLLLVENNGFSTNSLSCEKRVQFEARKLVQYDPIVVGLDGQVHKAISTKTITNSRLQMSNDIVDAEIEENDGDSSDSKMTIVKRKLRVEFGYQFSSWIYLAVSIFHLVSKGLNHMSFYYVTCGPALVAGIASILKGAAQHDRLGSDTYKRLNLSLIQFGILSLLLPIVDPIHFFSPVFVVPPLLLLLNSIKGYGYGVIGWDKSRHVCAVFTDLDQGFRSTIENNKVFRKESLAYLAMTIMVGMMTIAKSKEVITLAFTDGTLPVDLASRVSRLARLIVFTNVLYTLKDAADRNRLKGSTFVKLNYLSSAAFLSMAFYLKLTPLGGLALLFAVIPAYNAFKR